MDGSMPRVHLLREGETVIGRAPTCDLVITAALMSRQHARVRVDGGRAFLRDAGSTYGTTFKGVKITSEQEILPGDSFTLGPVPLTLALEVHENEVLSEKHQIFEESGTIVKRIDQMDLPPAAMPTSPDPATTPSAATRRAASSTSSAAASTVTSKAKAPAPPVTAHAP